MTSPQSHTDPAAAGAATLSEADIKLLERTIYEVKRVIVGQDQLIERILVGLLARGHILLEDNGQNKAPLALAAMSAKPAATFLLKRYSYRQVLTINTFLLGIMIAGFALISNQVPEWIIYVYLAIFGAVNSIQFTAMNTLTLIDLGGNLASSGNSLLSVVMQLAMSLGIAASAALLNGFVGQHAYQQLLPAQILSAFHATYVCIGIMSIIAVMIFLQLHPHAGQKTNSDTVEEH